MATQQNPFDISTGSTPKFVVGPTNPPAPAPPFSGVQGQGTGSGIIANAQQADQAYGEGNWYIGGPSGAFIQKPASQPTQQQMNQDHWSFYGPDPVTAAKNRAAGVAPSATSQAPAPAPAPAPAAPSSSPFVIGGVPTGTPSMASLNPPAPGGGAPAPGAGGGAGGGGAPAPGGSSSSGSSSQTSVPGTSVGGMGAAPQATATGWDPNSWNVTAPQTVQGQLGGILASNSPLLQKAQADALIQANGRGMLNTSMASGAATAAVMDKALQIATPDAQVNAQAGQYNANAANQSASDLAQARNQMSLSNADRSFDAMKTSYAAQVQEFMSKLDGGIKRDLAILDGDIKQKLAGIEAQFKTQMQTSQSAATMYGEALRSIGAIMTDKDMDAGAKQNAINLQMDALTRGLRLQTTIGNIPGIDAILASIGTPATVNLANTTDPAANPGGAGNGPNYTDPGQPGYESPGSP